MRYLIFAGQQYYASGGANDLVCIEEHQDVAERKALELYNIGTIEIGDKLIDLDIEWVQVFDLVNKDFIAEHGDVHYSEHGMLHDVRLELDRRGSG